MFNVQTLNNVQMLKLERMTKWDFLRHAQCIDRPQHALWSHIQQVQLSTYRSQLTAVFFLRPEAVRRRRCWLVFISQLHVWSAAGQFPLSITVRHYISLVGNVATQSLNSATILTCTCTFDRMMTTLASQSVSRYVSK